MKLKIALLQLIPANSLSKQLEKGKSACERAKKMGADIALFPEMWSNGYVIPHDTGELKKQAVSKDSAFIRDFAKLSERLDMAIGITFLETCEPAPKNSIIIFDRYGKERIHYSKVHTCDFGDEKVLTPGDDFYAADVDTAAGSVKIGSMICYDREFPESARILMLKNAEIILVPNACPMEINRLSQLRARAFENMTGIATCNYPAGKPDCNGHSSAFDGVAYLPELPDSRDTCILEADENEGIYIAEFDMDMLRDYRKNEVHGNAYRKPEKYGLLISEAVNEPFIRADCRRQGLNPDNTL